MNRAYLSLGTNINPETNLKRAVQLLAEQTRLVAVSSVWQTAPVGDPNQPNFLNAAAIVETPLTAHALKQQVLQPIERRLGRVRQADKNAPRPIDLDIILFNREVLTVGGRSIPDEEIFERAFVAIPLAELAPHYRHPKTNERLSQIAQRFQDATQSMQLRAEITEALQKIMNYKIGVSN